MNRKNKQIVIQDGMAERQTVKTLIHEIAHAFLHTKEQLKEDKRSREQKELEAESVAFIVCKHFGFDSDEYSFPYITSWAGNDFQTLLSSSLVNIQKTEAESVAFIVCKHFGFDSDEYSFPYITSWAGNDFQTLLSSSLVNIQKTDDEINK